MIAVAPLASAVATADSTSYGMVTPRESSHDARPTNTSESPPEGVSTSADTPRPAWFENPRIDEAATPRAPAPATMARAIGCSDADSTAAARPRIVSSDSRSLFDSGRVTMLSSDILPVVTVPVLSRTIVSIVRVCSSVSADLMTIPSWDARPDPTRRAVGVAKPSAHGQATTSTATPAVKAFCRDAPAISQPIKVSSAMPMTTGTKTPERRSASR